MDRISYLPQSILHNILSRLHDKDVAATSILSKAWHDAWSTFPFLVFDESRYETTEIVDDISIQVLVDKFNFIIWVFNTLLRFYLEGLAIKKINLIFKSLPPNSKSLLTLVDWMKWACDSGLEELKLDNGVDYLKLQYPRSCHSHEDFPCLPLCILEAKSLIKLELTWYFRFDQAFLNHPIKFSSLQVLSLTHVYLGDGQVIENLICSCPLIEKLELICCSGLNSVSIHDLPKLKIISIIGIEEVDVDAPSLEDLHIQGFQSFTACKINIDKCRNLQKLSLAYLNSIIITDQWFLELLRKFLLLEELMLEGFHMSDMIYISCVQLKDLSLVSCLELEEILIDAPNLHKFKYHCSASIFPFISISNSSSQLVLDVEIYVNFLDLEELKDFLESIEPKHIPISLFLGFDDHSTVDFASFLLQEFLVAQPSIKHLTLCATSDEEEWCLLLVTSFFWSCRPSIVSLIMDSSKTLVKIFCEKLIGREEDDSCCSSSSEIKCWWHFLKDVKISSSFKKHNAPDDLKSLLETFPTLSSKEEDEIRRFSEGHIQFKLEWQL